MHRFTLVDQFTLENWFNRSVQSSSPVVQSSEWIHPLGSLIGETATINGSLQSLDWNGGKE